MNSFNHYAYGAVLEWIAAKVVEITTELHGRKQLLFAVEPDQRHWVDFAIETPYGKRKANGDSRTTASVTIIVRLTAGKIILPNVCTGQVKLNGEAVAKTSQELPVSGTWHLTCELQTENKDF